jgi:hypothetical protein
MKNTIRVGGPTACEPLKPPVAADAVIEEGMMVAYNAAGYLVPWTSAINLKALGRAEEAYDNTGGANGAKRIKVSVGVYLLKNYASDLVTRAILLGNCFIYNSETVRLTNPSGTTTSIAGVVIDVTPGGVIVSVGPR